MLNARIYFKMSFHKIDWNPWKALKVNQSKFKIRLSNCELFNPSYIWRASKAKKGPSTDATYPPTYLIKTNAGKRHYTHSPDDCCTGQKRTKNERTNHSQARTVTDKESSSRTYFSPPLLTGWLSATSSKSFSSLSCSLYCKDPAIWGRQDDIVECEPRNEG